jgi:hypothetical protein
MRQEGRAGRMAKKLGVIYCGGCNPDYERVEMVDQVRSLLRTLYFVPGRDAPDLDLIVYVSGCPRACADKNPEPLSVPARSITSDRDFKSLIDWLNSCIEN